MPDTQELDFQIRNVQIAVSDVDRRLEQAKAELKNALQQIGDGLRQEIETMKGTIPTKGEGPIQVKGNVISIQDNRLDGGAAGVGNGNSSGGSAQFEVIENGAAFLWTFFNVQFDGPL